MPNLTLFDVDSRIEAVSLATCPNWITHNAKHKTLQRWRIKGIPLLEPHLKLLRIHQPSDVPHLKLLRIRQPSDVPACVHLHTRACERSSTLN